MERSERQDQSAVMLSFWAKSVDGGGTPMHSIAHHALDVAAVATALVPIMRGPVEVAPETLAALIALHDIGKFTLPFQAKVEALWPAALGAFRPGRAGWAHDDARYVMLVRPLSRSLAPLFVHWPNPLRRTALLRAVTGHHGRPHPSAAPALSHRRRLRSLPRSGDDLRRGSVRRAGAAAVPGHAGG